MKQRILFIALLLNALYSIDTHAQLLQWNTFGNAGTETTEPSVANDANVSAANLTLGSVTAAANGNRFGGSNWFDTGDTNPTTLAESITGNDYIQFIVTPNSGFDFTPTSFVFNWDRSASGPSSVALRSSVDGFAANLGTVTGIVASAFATNTITISGLSNITTATTFRIYGYGATGTGGTGGFDIGSNVVNVVLNGSTSPTCTAPSTQASAFTNPILNATSATIGWTRGNGNNVLVVARSGSAVVDEPVSGTAYTANAAFGSGDAIGTGFVVYNGTGTSVNITSLATGTAYHFAIYEYNTVSTCYNLTQLTGNITTPVVPPLATFANNGTQVTAANVSQNTADHILHQFQLSITQANTILSGVACTTTGTYLAADVTNLKVRYSTDNILDVADLTLSTLTSPGVAGSKTFPAFTTQAMTTGSVGYIFITADIPNTATLGNTIGVGIVTLPNVSFTSTPATIKAGSTTAGGLQTIIIAAPAVPATFTRSCVSNSTVTLNWTAPASGTFDGYLLVVREAATPNAVTSIVASSQSFNLDYTLAPTYNATTSRVLYIGTATTAIVTGLTQGISYTFAIYAYKNNGSSSVYSTSRTTTQVVNLSNVTGQGSTSGNASGSISWTSPTNTCYDEILVVATTAAGITFVPSGNGSAYVPSTVYAGANSIVFNNAGNFVTVTGLTNGVTYYFEIFVRKGTQWSSGVEVSLTPNLATIFKPGELVFVGFDGQYLGAGPDDQYMVATMVDILPGTTFSIANSRYEAGAAANVRTDKWGGAGDDPSALPGVTNFTYNGPGNITSGSVMIFQSNSSNVFNYAAVITGTTLTVRTTDFSFLQPGLSAAPNITTTNGDGEQIYLLQGSFVSDGTIDANEANYILNGTLLHGFTIKTGWVPFTSACSGVNGGGSNRQSRLPIALNCFNVESSTSTTISGYYENAAQHGSTTLRNIIRAIADITNNWTISNTRYTIDATSSASNRAGKTFIISTGEATGQWIGDTDTNWFNCSNWGRLTVPDETVDVVIDAVTSVGNAAIDYTAANSDFYLDLAVCNNLTISGRNLIIQGSSSNKIEVYGGLTIGPLGTLDMNDSVNGTADGQLYLYGNWTNNGTNSSFDEGESTVHFMGSIAQIVNNVSPRGTELFYNVLLNNDFNTAISNDLIAQGDLTINSGKIVNIDSNGFIFAYKKLNHSGDLTIANNGQFIQVDETDANTGTYTGTKFQVTRTAQAKNLDYVYWSAPTESFAVSNVPTNYRYEWNTLYANANGTQGNWTAASGNMAKGKGYIARASNGSATPISLSSIFTGKPNNGQFTFAINRGTYDGIDYDADLTSSTNLLTTKFDDNWNLLGNPYPSALDAEEFLVENQTKIEGAVWIWTHGLNPASNVSPFYNNFLYNYSSSDYIKYNGLGSTDPDTFAGKIASGQGFMVNMLHATATPNTVSFTNNMRSDATFVSYDNTDFFRSANPITNDDDVAEEKHRIWLDIINNNSGKSDRTLVGYSTSSTLGVDHLYDCIFKATSELSMYSIINSEPFIIQGRPLPFNSYDVVPMGIKIGASGSHTIAIKKVDGLFLDPTQGIYLEDKLLNITHDLRQNPYNFNADTGTFNDRFLLRFNSTTLVNPDFGSADNTIIVTANHGEMSIKSFVQNIQEVTVYDILGRQLFNAKSIENKDFSASNIAASKQALIVKIKLENGIIVTRKIIL